MTSPRLYQASSGRAQPGPWGRVRLALGLAQMGGATTALVLLAEGGVTRAAMYAVVATTVMTTLSVLLFGRERPRWTR